MTAAFAQEYEELHRLVDRLPVERMRALRVVALYLVEGVATDQAQVDRAGGRQRRLSFAGIMDAEPDLATRSGMKRTFLRRPMPAPDGVNLADDIVRERDGDPR